MLTLAEMMTQAGMLRTLGLWMLLIVAAVVLVFIAVVLGAKRLLTAPLRLLKRSKPGGPGRDGA